MFSYGRKNNFPRNLHILPIGPIHEKFLPAKTFLHYCPKNFLVTQTMKDCTIPACFHVRTKTGVVSEQQLNKLDPPLL